MHADPHPSMIPLERYRTLIGLLSRDSDAWDDSLWLRFAAQVVVMSPDSPQVLAQRIRDVANALLKQSPWYHTLASPVRFVVASMLIQHHIRVADFTTEHAHVESLMSSVGLRHERFYEVIAVIILLMTPGHRSATMTEIMRLKAIYDHMKSFHWWLTGPDDLPACAALAQCPGPAGELVKRVESAYQQLHSTGILTGERLQTAANLLPLAGPDIDQTVLRFRGLADALITRIGALNETYYDPLALLTLLDHDPELVVGRLTAVNRELDLFQPESVGEVNFLIASDLTFLDLMRCDRQLQPFTRPAAAAFMLDALHAFHLGSAVLLSQVDAGRVQFVGNGVAPAWPYPYPLL